MTDWSFMSSGYSNSQRGQYDNALICENGHIINSMANQFPEDNKKYCDKCGKVALTKCDKCGTLFKGNIMGNIYELPSFCENCGSVFPWTQLKIETAIELALSSDLIDDNDRGIIKNAVPEIVRDTPRTMLESTKFKKILFKIGNGTGTMIKETLAAIISETAKKIIWPESK